MYRAYPREEGAVFCGRSGSSFTLVPTWAVVTSLDLNWNEFSQSTTGISHDQFGGAKECTGRLRTLFRSLKTEPHLPRGHNNNMLAKRLFIHARPNSNDRLFLPCLDLIWNESSKSTYWELLKIEFAEFRECVWRLQITPFEERFSQKSSHSFSDMDAVPAEVGIWISTGLPFKQDSIYISTWSTMNGCQYVVFPSSSSTASLYCLVKPCQCQEKDHINTWGYVYWGVWLMWLRWVSMYVVRTLDSGGNKGQM